MIQFDHICSIITIIIIHTRIFIIHMLTENPDEPPLSPLKAHSFSLFTQPRSPYLPLSLSELFKAPEVPLIFNFLLAAIFPFTFAFVLTSQHNHLISSQYLFTFKFLECPFTFTLVVKFTFTFVQVFI